MWWSWKKPVADGGKVEIKDYWVVDGEAHQHSNEVVLSDHDDHDDHDHDHDHTHDADDDDTLQTNANSSPCLSFNLPELTPRISTEAGTDDH